MFAGIEGIARKVTGAHIGVDGVSRKVKKAYVGVDGVARLAWEAGGRVRAYLYNGVKLPEFPERDIVAFPYAYISQSTKNNDRYFVSFSPVALVVSGSIDGDLGMYAPEGTYPLLRYFITQGESAWSERTETVIGSLLGTTVAMWCNETLYHKDGTVYLEASGPVPLYSYNGVELPELPEWDRSVYPYARIRNDGDSTYYLEVFSEKPVTVTWKNPITGKTVEKNGMSASGKWGSNSVMPGTIDNWGDSPSFVDNDYSMKNIDTILWANYDISYVDGTTYLEASDPVPVYI